MGIMIIIICVLYIQREETPENDDQEDLEEWTCPDCGFAVQLGTECPFCYTKKPT
jgi:rubrerythrin